MMEGLTWALTYFEAVLYGAKYRPIKLLLYNFWSTETQSATLISTVQISRSAFMRCCRQLAVHVDASRSPPTDIDVACRYCGKGA